MLRKSLYLVTGLLAVILVLPTVANSQEGKIGIIDSQRIFAESKEFSDAQAKFDKDVAAWNNQAEVLQTEIDDLEQELESQSLLLSKAKREEKENLLNAKKAAFQDFVSLTFGPDGKAERRNAELVRPIRDKMIRIIERIAIDNNYSIVLDAGVTSIAYSKKDLDITEQVMEELVQEE